MEVVTLRARDLHVAEAAIGADAVVDVYDVVVRLQLGQGREEVARPLAPAAAHLASLAEDLGLGDEHELVLGEPRTPRQLAGEGKSTLSAGGRLRERRTSRGRRDPVGPEERRDPVAMGVAARDEHEPGPFPFPFEETRRDRAERAVGAGGRAQGEPVGRVGRGAETVAGEQLEALRVDACVTRSRRPPGRGRYVEAGRRGMEAPLAGGGVGMGLDLRPGRFHGRLDLGGALHPEERSRRQEIGERSKLVVEVGQQVLRPGKDEAAANGLDQVPALLACQADLRGPLVDLVGSARLEPGQTELAHRQQEHVLQPVERALRRRIELPDAVDGVPRAGPRARPHEVEADRPGVAGRKDIEQPAAQREITRVLHERHPVVPPLHQPLGERRGRGRLTAHHVGDGLGEGRAREAPLDPCLGGRHDHGPGRLDEVVEALHARRHRLAWRRERLEGRHLPCREVVDAPRERAREPRVAEEKADIGGECFGLSRPTRASPPQPGGGPPAAGRGREQAHYRAAPRHAKASRGYCPGRSRGARRARRQTFRA